MNDVDVKSSPIDGLGLFAARSFRAGERIRRVYVVREVTPATPLREDLGERFDHCDYPDGKVVLLGFPDRHINHRCDPNAWELHEPGAIWFVARRDIRSGEEITCDYNVNIADRPLLAKWFVERHRERITALDAADQRPAIRQAGDP
jgi:SET domain-containing protein